MVLAGHRGKRRVLFIFGTQYIEFLPVVQTSASWFFSSSFYPHTMQDCVVWSAFFQVLESEVQTHVKLSFRKHEYSLKNSTKLE
jgi:hypothetical protein